MGEICTNGKTGEFSHWFTLHRMFCYHLKLWMCGGIHSIKAVFGFTANNMTHVFDEFIVVFSVSYAFKGR